MNQLHSTTNDYYVICISYFFDFNSVGSAAGFISLDGTGLGSFDLAFVRTGFGRSILRLHLYLL